MDYEEVIPDSTHYIIQEFSDVHGWLTLGVNDPYWNDHEYSNLQSVVKDIQRAREGQSIADGMRKSDVPLRVIKVTTTYELVK
jgi:hypothetical protein